MTTATKSAARAAVYAVLLLASAGCVDPLTIARGVQEAVRMARPEKTPEQQRDEMLEQIIARHQRRDAAWREELNARRRADLVEAICRDAQVLHDAHAVIEGEQGRAAQTGAGETPASLVAKRTAKEATQRIAEAFAAWERRFGAEPELEDWSCIQPEVAEVIRRPGP